MFDNGIRNHYNGGYNCIIWISSEKWSYRDANFVQVIVGVGPDPKNNGLTSSVMANLAPHPVRILDAGWLSFTDAPFDAILIVRSLNHCPVLIEIADGRAILAEVLETELRFRQSDRRTSAGRRLLGEERRMRCESISSLS
jgi:hypothetical protein